MGELLTLQSIDARAILLPLRRPIVSKVGRFDDWPMILIDVYTREGIVGHSYLEPYLKDALGVHHCARSNAWCGASWQANCAARRFPIQSQVAKPDPGTKRARNDRHIRIDMAIWDALAKAAALPLTRLFGRTVGPVPAYNSNGLWLTEVSTLANEATELCAEGGFTALKLRLGRDSTRCRSRRDPRGSTGCW